jgi:FkbM family methyltransferase
MIAPLTLLVPRKLARDGLAGYERPAVSCFLATLDNAGSGAFFDVGANVGLYAGLASALTERPVVAFEPTPELAGVARRFALDNHLGFRTESIALGGRTGTATLYSSDSTDSSNSPAAGFRKSSKQQRVPVETLDDYVKRSGLTPAVIKVDIETTEPEVLFGAADTIKVHRPWILCGVLAGRVEERLTEALTPHGYHWYRITGEVPYPPADTIQGDTTHVHVMWLFAPETPDDDFWAAVRKYDGELAMATA